jgi:hypothetical protein
VLDSGTARDSRGPGGCFAAGVNANATSGASAATPADLAICCHRLLTRAARFASFRIVGTHERQRTIFREGNGRTTDRICGVLPLCPTLPPEDSGGGKPGGSRHMCLFRLLPPDGLIGFLLVSVFRGLAAIARAPRALLSLAFQRPCP